ncbi:acyl-CoA dehydrogenase [Nocardioides houyundeii]|uniref:acyl-CoA dehydrogenase n=1 Tax=Nocardioides houyundeii TaxID=2045452 RepID=UPI000C75DF12|nr:acyl-CoA dehydrogenase [Nocardioides houyundeii]
MPIPITDEHHELAAATRGFAERHAPTAWTRSAFEPLAGGGRPAFWEALVAQGLHAIHLDEDAGGQGGTVLDLAVVVEQAGHSLLPGPFTPTVAASAVLSAAQPGPWRDEMLARLAAGAPAAIVLPGSGLSVRAAGEGWLLSGRSVPVLGLLSAEIVLVGVTESGAEADSAVWFALEAGTLTPVVEVGTDLTRDLGRLELGDLDVPGDALVEGIDSATAGSTVAALYAAEASGLARWVREAAIDYVKVREQFGVPVGSFQAVKHKAARLFISSELAAAAAWDAARSLTQSVEQQSLAVGAAGVVALDAAAETVIGATTMFGGIGFTWEHDIHLYMRRAMSIAALSRPVGGWDRQLGEAALAHERDVSFELLDEEPAFREWVARTLDEALTISVAEGTREGWSGAVAPGPRRSFLAENGLVSSHWPKPWGLGATPVEQIVIAEEYAARNLPQPSTVIGEWAVPTILAHGTDAQAERFARATLRGDIVWCQLFSEPGAGSDLAGLSTRAVKQDDGWLINGQKVWTSSAHEADWGICLARTDPSVPKHRGLTYFLIDMRSPGVEVRPLKQSTGHSEFNEVFLTDVFVPDDLMVGEPGQGWRLTATTLANERLSIGSGLGAHKTSDALRELLRKEPVAVARDQALSVLGRAFALDLALLALNRRELFRRLSGLEPGASSSVAKVASALAAQQTHTAALGLLGAEGSLDDAPGGLVQNALSLPSSLVGGGTVEIQLNIIAERILGLPR